MIKIIALSVYSIIVSPLLIFFSGRSEKVHDLLSRPLLSGEFSKPLVGELDHLVFRLESEELSDYEFIKLISDAMVSAVNRGDLNDYLSRDVGDDENIDITLKKKLFYVPLKWWYLKIHYMAPGNVHGLHAHRNVISTQVILKGRLKVKEYDRVGHLDSSPVKLKLHSDTVYSKFDSIQSTDNFCNVHGFEPANGPAVRFQFYLRGHTSLLSRFPKRGRLYVNVIDEAESGQYVLAAIGDKGKSGES